jgi:hypothetical protein
MQQISTSRGETEAPCKGPCRGPIGTQLRAGFIGSLPGWAVGITTGALLAKKAPTYGRVALLQSAALGGGILGAITQVALQWKPYGDTWGFTVRAPPKEMPNPTDVDCIGTGDEKRCAYPERSALDLMPGTLIGLNVGLVAGILGAYLPDQSRPGPSWRRVLFVDLAVGAGAIAGATFGCVSNPKCLNQSPEDEDRAIAAGAALLGAGLGFAGGVLLTRHIDDSAPETRSSPPPTMPVATFAPIRDAAGGIGPGVAAMGTF